MDLRQSFSPTNIALVAVFAGLIAASTIWPGFQLAAGVPITLQTFPVFLAGAVLGPWRGAAAVVLYLVLGAAGLPIFSGHKAGPAVFLGPTGGFLVGFVVAAFVTGWLVRSFHRKHQLNLARTVVATAVGSLVVLNLIGYTWLGLRASMRPADVLAFAVPYLPGDIIKLFLAAVVAFAIHRAYPQLLADNRRVGDAGAVEPEDEASSATA